MRLSTREMAREYLLDVYTRGNCQERAIISRGLQAEVVRIFNYAIAARTIGIIHETVPLYRIENVRHQAVRNALD